MSREIGILPGAGPRLIPLSVVQFYGGNKAGRCLQLTADMENGEAGYIQLSEQDIMILLPVLWQFIISLRAPEKAEFIYDEGYKLAGQE